MELRSDDTNGRQRAGLEAPLRKSANGSRVKQRRARALRRGPSGHDQASLYVNANNENTRSRDVTRYSLRRILRFRSVNSELLPVLVPVDQPLARERLR